MKQRSWVSTDDMSPEIVLRIQSMEEQNSERDGFLTFEVERSDTDERLRCECI